jgi:hypothetical protein
MAAPLLLSEQGWFGTSELTDDLAISSHAWSYIEVYSLCSSVGVTDCGTGEEKYAKGKSTWSDTNQYNKKLSYLFFQGVYPQEPTIVKFR